MAAGVAVAGSDESWGDAGMKLVFLLEEYSAKILLDELLPKILPEDVEFQTIPHNGKKALESAIPKKLRGWNEPDVRFVILEDQDAKDCVELKTYLRSLCEPTKKPVLVRIACQELESWYFGDMHAVALAYQKPKLLRISEQKKYRIPDRIPSPKEEFYKLVPEHQQMAGAKRIGAFMTIEQNTSVSFQFFVDGVRRLANQTCVAQS